MKGFDELIEMVQRNPQRKRVAVAAAHDVHTLEGINHAYECGIVLPILIGRQGEIQRIIEKEGFSFKGKIINIYDETEAAQMAVELIHEGKADFIMKGKLQTADLLKQVVNRRTGLKEAEVMSHVALLEIPGYQKLVAVTDGGMLPSPTLHQKLLIVQNAVSIMNLLGCKCPKVAALSAAEAVNPKIRASVEAAELKQMNENHIIEGCVVEGPISYDLAMNAEAAELKGYKGLVSGDADILLVPDMTTGNLMAKALIYSGGAKMAGIIVGARVPIVLVSRGASSEEKYYSIVLAAATAEGLGGKV